MAIAHLHNGDLISNILVLIGVFGFDQLKSKVLIISLSSDMEYSCEASSADSVDKDVVLAGLISFENFGFVNGSFDLTLLGESIV